MSDEILSLIYTFSKKFCDPETNLSFDPKNQNISAVVKEGNVNIYLLVKGQKENKKKLESPIILLTAKGEANERIEGLEIGADDYLPKPFEPKELILRIKNILNKTIKTDQKRVIEFENVKIDLNKLIIIKKKKRIQNK